MVAAKQMDLWRAYYLLEPWGFEFENDWRIEAAYIGGIKPNRGRKIESIFGHQSKIKPAKKMMTPDDFRSIGEAYVTRSKKVNRLGK